MHHFDNPAIGIPPICIVSRHHILRNLDCAMRNREEKTNRQASELQTQVLNGSDRWTVVITGLLFIPHSTQWKLRMQMIWKPKEVCTLRLPYTTGV